MLGGSAISGGTSFSTSSSLPVGAQSGSSLHGLVAVAVGVALGVGATLAAKR